MANRNPILLRPHWIIRNELVLPLVVVNDQGATSVRGLIQLFVPITIFLDTLFDDTPGYTSRNMESDQFQIYKSIEGILQTMGINGKACLLRTICEMQEHPIGEFTVIGEIITIVLTPKRGIRDFLHEYLEAEQIGQSHNMSCSKEFLSCPISLYNLFGLYSDTDSSSDSSNQLVEDDDEVSSSESPKEQLTLENENKQLIGDAKLIKERFHDTDKPFNHLNHLDY